MVDNGGHPAGDAQPTAANQEQGRPAGHAQPPRPPTRKKLVLRGAMPSLPPSPTERKVVPRAMRSPPPPATAVRISSGRSSVGSVDATIRRQASEQYFDYRSSVKRALLASKSWTRTGKKQFEGITTLMTWIGAIALTGPGLQRLSTSRLVVSDLDHFIRVGTARWVSVMRFETLPWTAATRRLC
jgi:hypothetical protein